MLPHVTYYREGGGGGGRIRDVIPLLTLRGSAYPPPRTPRDCAYNLLTEKCVGYIFETYAYLTYDVRAMMTSVSEYGEAGGTAGEGQSLP